MTRAAFAPGQAAARTAYGPSFTVRWRSCAYGRAMTIETIVQARTKNATALPVDAQALASLGAGKRPWLRVTINGHTYSARVGIMRGEHLIPLPAEARAAAGVAAGDHVRVELEPDARG